MGSGRGKTRRAKTSLASGHSKKLWSNFIAENELEDAKLISYYSAPGKPYDKMELYEKERVEIFWELFRDFAAVSNVTLPGAAQWDEYSFAWVTNVAGRDHVTGELFLRDAQGEQLAVLMMRMDRVVNDETRMGDSKLAEALTEIANRFIMRVASK